MKKIGILLLVVAGISYAMDYHSLPLPDFSSANVLEQRVGIRPYRKGSIRMEMEKLEDNTTIFHNYGHGGGGISLSWGSAYEMCAIFEKAIPSFNKNEQIAVVGAGIIGLTQAHALLEAGYKNIRLYAKETTPHTTADVAAGVWGPSTVARGETPEQKEQYERVEKKSFEVFKRIAEQQNPDLPGVAWVESYRIFNSADERLKNPPFCIKNLEHTTINCNSTLLPVARYESIVVDISQYLPALLTKVQKLGATVEIRAFQDRNDIQALPEKIVFNCTGLGAREIFNDTNMVPVQGHVVAFKQDPAHKIAYRLMKYNVDPNKDITAMLIPWKDQFLVGTITEEGKEDRTVNLETCALLVACLKKAMAID